MEKEITFKHSVTSFPKRIRYLGIIFIYLLSLFLFPYLLETHIESLAIPIIITTLIFIVFYIFLIWKNKLYLSDFYSDSNSVYLRYYDGNKELEINQPLNQIQVHLKNTTTRFGFDCELILKIENKKFYIDDTFNWSLAEMKTLFEYIKHFKNETLSEKDKFNIQKIEDKWKNR